MKKLVSIKYSPAVFNISFLLLRLIFGVAMMVNHGYPKLVKFASVKNDFDNFLGIGSAATLVLVIFAELFCSALLVLGLFSRIVVIPLVICMGYALFIVHGNDLLGDGESAALYLTIYLTILFCGPGKYSVDGMMQK